MSLAYVTFDVSLASGIIISFISRYYLSKVIIGRWDIFRPTTVKQAERMV